MTVVTIAEMASDDIGAVVQIDALCYPDPVNEQAWFRELNAPGRCHLVARIENEIVGHAGSLLIVDEMHVSTVAVAPCDEGAGIGTRLVAELLHRGIDAGATAATLEVRVSSARPQRLYSRLGFVPAGVRSSYYSNPTEDAVIMWLHDLASAPVRDRIKQVTAKLGVVSSGGPT